MTLDTLPWTRPSQNPERRIGSQVGKATSEIRRGLHRVSFPQDEHSGNKPGKLHSIEEVEKTFYTIHMDQLEPFVRTQSGNAYISVAIDGFEKCVLLRAVRNASARSELLGPDSGDHEPRNCIHKRKFKTM